MLDANFDASTGADWFISLQPSAGVREQMPLRATQSNSDQRSHASARLALRIGTTARGEPQSPARSGSADQPTPQHLRLAQPEPQWPDDDDVLLSDTRVMRALCVAGPRCSTPVRSGDR